MLARFMIAVREWHWLASCCAKLARSLVKGFTSFTIAALTSGRWPITTWMVQNHHLVHCEQEQTLQCDVAHVLALGHTQPGCPMADCKANIDSFPV